jgi:hypothetical protein
MFENIISTILSDTGIGEYINFVTVSIVSTGFTCIDGTALRIYEGTKTIGGFR